LKSAETVGAAPPAAGAANDFQPGSLTAGLHRALRDCPDAEAVTAGELRFTYAAFVDRVARLAGALRSLGLQPGDRVGMLALNSHRYFEYFFAAWWAGGVINPVNIRWSPKEVAYSLDDCDTRILLVDETFAPLIPTSRELSASLQTVVYAGDGRAPEGTFDYETLLAAAKPLPDAGRGGDDLAAVMYTGGTTGRPKGVMLSHHNLTSNVANSLAAVPRPPGAVAVIAAPVFHIGGCALALQNIITHRRAVIIPMFEEIAVLRAIQDERATGIFLVPSMLKRVIEHPRFHEFDVSSLAMMIYGAAPIDGALLERAMAAFPRAEFFQAYGMTECSPTITSLPAEAHSPEGVARGLLRSAGRPLPGVEVRIVDPEGREVPVGTVGEIAARGATVMRGYWNRPKETAAAVRDGWMHTGDGGYVDAEGYLYVVDRIKDMIITGGENVYSAEVENAISSHPDVSMSAVIGIPDDEFGERVHAVVVPRPGTAPNERAIVEHCRSLIGGFKCPRSIEFRDQLPLSAAGKVLKHELRAPFWNGRTRRVN
jgi:acyl-CoA synthetase (AMP-forming)/AMP-acid ligase II